MYTSLAVSKLIEEKVPEVETYMFWLECWSADPELRSEWVLRNKDEKSNRPLQYPAYTLADVIKAIKVLGEKEEWGDEKFEAFGVTTDEVVARRCHELIDAYLPSLSLQDPHVEKFLTDLFNN